ncbi:dihydrofolate reductase family protein [Aquisphaera insulae]|uniref:dihydrofolate reductase family protein n=1 Tax=Aquisphaera insulae TaxID=2712864 RepID=UPI0013EE0D96|nr:dihydrofolate reductase family protein [Aquisphaera insulae]
MRNIRIFAHTSLDGVISPSGQGEDSEYAHGGWTAPYRSPAGAAAVAEAQGTGFALLLGRRTYDLWAGFWPKAPSSPISDALNAATKYVATRRPESLGWGPVGDLGADILEGIRRLRSGDGPDLVVWGSTAVTSLLFEHELVDELVLIVYPILLGKGKRLFPEGADPRELAFVSTQAMTSGVLINSYRRAGSRQADPSPT